MASGTPVLLNATVVSMTIGVFEAQPHFRTVFLQIQKLLAVKSSTPLSGRQNQLPRQKLKGSCFW
jgi:hypothetical protein